MPNNRLTADDYKKRRVKAARSKKGLTQAKVAKKLGISQSNYQRIESNLVEYFKLDVMWQLCRTLDLNPLELISEED
jgi:transcriptional regulator with XRE-family HTH domain